MDYVIRSVRAEDWPLAKELRLAALQDPMAPVAFLETYEDAVSRPDAFWQQRTADAAEGIAVRQFVAERPDGGLAGTVTALVERPDGDTRFGAAAQVDQTHVVGVFVHEQDRGNGLTDELFRSAIEWSWSLAEPRVERVRLYVHERNPRAAAAYRRIGFVPSGQTVAVPHDPDARELEYVIERARAEP
ncbi:GNAT family N-acetyltransferase [Streptomyces finlayi]|uniref:GNAT family N-acetyltransferase n=1 Tax=Streptomyces finlayi TaxID=67296 RepID=A0A7G7BKU4_9ACTN|nr:GNAT family N-acetyltransferase [Streptomyces finlayi]QNE75959.1 GNAT family N-acetyltransferase [Streptomyces finlayi]